MLAARGVSLGLGKDINFSGLNKLSTTDRALLGRIQRHKDKLKKTNEQKLVIRKRVDSRTLWVACVTVIFGSAIIVLGFLATVAGYFDHEIVGKLLTLPTPNRSYSGLSITQADKTGNGLIWFFIKSLQYVGPVLMGIGMFSLIMACVLTLESRDKHTQIIEKSTENSNKLRNDQTREKINKTSISILNYGDLSKINENETQDQYSISKNSNEYERTETLNLVRTPNGVPQTRSLAVVKEPENNVEGDSISILEAGTESQVYESPEISGLERKTMTVYNMNITEGDSSTTDALADYTFPNHGNFTCSSKNLTKRRSDSKINERKTELESKKLFEKESMETRTARQRSSQLASINRLTPRGLAPLVHVDSVVELSNSMS